MVVSVFPELFNYSQVSPLILRIFLALCLLTGAKEKFAKIIQIICALFLFLGLYTQIAALLTIVVLMADKTEEKKTKILMIITALSLIFSGPGLFSFDLPL